MLTAHATRNFENAGLPYTSVTDADKIENLAKLQRIFKLSFYFLRRLKHKSLRSVITPIQYQKGAKYFLIHLLQASKLADKFKIVLFGKRSKYFFTHL